MVRVRLEKKNGKTVTLIEDLPMHPDGKLQLLRRLQALCGAGGALKNGVAELQGDHRAKTADALVQLGHKVRVIQ